MNGSREANAALLTGILEGLEGNAAACAVCVPSPYLFQCEQLLQGSKLAWGAQDVSAQPSGAYTGEVAASMLLDFHCRYAIVGHSERRAYHGESNELVARKAQAALAAGLTPIVCVGETLGEREAGETASVVGAQLDAVLELLGKDAAARIVVAYEPVWAIGTGILYGGSMKPDNAADLMAQPDIDGGLIGGAALKAADFLAIIRAAS